MLLTVRGPCETSHTLLDLFDTLTLSGISDSHATRESTSIAKTILAMGRFTNIDD